MGLIKLAYDNYKPINAIKLVRGDKDAIMKTQITTLKTVVDRRTN